MPAAGSAGFADFLAEVFRHAELEDAIDGCLRGLPDEYETVLPPRASRKQRIAEGLEQEALRRGVGTEGVFGWFRTRALTLACRRRGLGRPISREEAIALLAGVGAAPTKPPPPTVAPAGTPASAVLAVAFRVLLERLAMERANGDQLAVEATARMLRVEIDDCIAVLARVDSALRGSPPTPDLYPPTPDLHPPH